MELSALVTPYAHGAARGLEVAGISVIIVGALVGCALFARRWVKGGDAEGAYQVLRMQFGRAILLGLEFLVAADIIGTVAVEPTYENLGILGLIVLIRTFLSFSLEVEINGRWPWQSQRGEQAPRA